MAKTQTITANKLKNPKILVLLVVLLGFGGWGVWKLAFSSAATPQTTLYGYVDASSFTVNNNGAPTLIDDYLSEASGDRPDSPGGAVSSIGPIKTVDLKAGDVLTYGGKGGRDSTEPAWVSTTNCYILRATTAQDSRVSISAGRTSTSAIIKPAPSKFDSAYWVRKCVTDTATSGNYIPYSVKVLSGGPVRVFRVETLNTLAY